MEWTVSNGGTPSGFASRGVTQTASLPLSLWQAPAAPPFTGELDRAKVSRLVRGSKERTVVHTDAQGFQMMRRERVSREGTVVDETGEPWRRRGGG